uniref:USP domain-containing protein n=1 Tax=Macrostomum lignano TaxID=282301 RepID=A0A1I8F4V2_9PLAT
LPSSGGLRPPLSPFARPAPGCAGSCGWLRQSVASYRWRSPVHRQSAVAWQPAMTSSAQRNSLLVRGVRRLRLELIERRDESFQKSDGATAVVSGSAIVRIWRNWLPRTRRREEATVNRLGAVAENSDDDEAAGMAQPHSFSPSSSTYSSGSNRNSLSGLSSRPRLVSPDVTAIYEKVLDGSIALENVCLACGTVRVEQQLPLLMEHPVLRGSLCLAKRIISDNGWLCHLCQLLSERLIQPGATGGSDCITKTEPHSLHPPPRPDFKRSSAGCSQPLRVLSLFDGVASRLAVPAVRRPVRRNLLRPPRSTRTQSVWPLVNHGNRQGLASESGLCFFSSFHRILETARRIGSPSADERQRRPLFWLFENVASMRQEDKTRISRSC